MALALHASSATFACGTGAHTVRLFLNGTTESSESASISDAPIAILSFAPVKRPQLIAADAQGASVVLLAPSRDGAQLVRIAAFEPTRQPPRAIEWLRPALGFACDAATPSTLPLGVEGFVEVGANGGVVLRWRQSFGSEAADSAAATAATAAAATGGAAHAPGWHSLRGKLGEAAWLCAVSTTPYATSSASKAGVTSRVLLATTPAEQTHCVHLWAVELPRTLTDLQACTRADGGSADNGGTDGGGAANATTDPALGGWCGLRVHRLAELSARATVSQLAFLAPAPGSRHSRPHLLIVTSNDGGGGMGGAGGTGGVGGVGGMGGVGGGESGAELWQPSAGGSGEQEAGGRTPGRNSGDSGGGGDGAEAAWSCVLAVASLGVPSATGLSCSETAAVALLSHKDGSFSTLQRAGGPDDEAAFRIARVESPIGVAPCAGRCDDDDEEEEEEEVAPVAAKRPRRASKTFAAGGAGAARGASAMLSPHGLLLASSTHGERPSLTPLIGPLAVVAATAGGVGRGSAAPAHDGTGSIGAELVRIGGESLCARARALSLGAGATPSAPWDVYAALAALPADVARRSAHGIARRLESRLDELWAAMVRGCARQPACDARPARSLSPSASWEQLCAEAPRACALLSSVWRSAEAAAMGSASPAAAMGSGSLVAGCNLGAASCFLADGSRLSVAWRAHAALWVGCEIVADELDRWGAAVADGTCGSGGEAWPAGWEQVESVANVAASVPSGSSHELTAEPGLDVSPNRLDRGRGGTGGSPPPPGGEMRSSPAGGEMRSSPAGGEMRSPAATRGEPRTMPRPRAPDWTDCLAHLTGTSRLSSMSERRLAELSEPCAQLLLLFVAWADATHAALAAEPNNPPPPPPPKPPPPPAIVEADLGAADEASQASPEAMPVAEEIKVDVEMASGAEAQAKAEAKANVKAEAKAEAKANVKAEAKAEQQAKPEAVEDSEAEAGSPEGGVSSRTRRLLASPPAPFGAVLPRAVAVLLAARVRLGSASSAAADAGGGGEGAGGAGAAAGAGGGGGGGGGGGSLWTEEQLKTVFFAATQRLSGQPPPPPPQPAADAGARGSGRSPRSSGGRLEQTAPMATGGVSSIGGLGSKVAWGVASVRLQYGLVRTPGLLAGEFGAAASVRGGGAAAELYQPAVRRAFDALMRWAGDEAMPMGL